MSGDESSQSRQENELEALKAIYGEDLKDLRGKTAWNLWTPLNLTVSLRPQQGSSGILEVNAKVVLHIECSETYPNSVPRIHLENSKGLSDNDLSQLYNNLEEKAESFKGEEMIFQLAQYVQEFLHFHNKPATKSFFDEMLQRRKEQEEKDLQAKQIEADKQREDILREIQMREEMLEREYRQRKEQRHNSDNSVESEGDSRRYSFSNNTFDNSVGCNEHNKETVVVEFPNRRIQRGRCLKHCSYNHVGFFGIDLKNGEPVHLSEWIFEVRNITEMNNVKKQLNSIEQELTYFSKLKHCNLSHYLSLKYETQGDKVIVYMLKEFINGPSCSLFINEYFGPSIQFVKYLAKGVLTALDYLHRNNVVHKDIRDSSIYLNDKGTVLLTNYSLNRRLRDLSTQSNTSYNKKTDIYKFGILLVSLLQGSPVNNDEVDIPSSLPSDLYDFLIKCLSKREDKERHTATKLLNHPFFSQAEILNSPIKHRNDFVPEGDLALDAPQDESLPQFQSSSQSRIDSEFLLLQPLGQGGFGDVVKAKNNLDGGYYAIKRIKLNPKNRQLNKKIMREVQLLSRLNHENVVRYYNSWIETTIIKKENDDSSSATTTTTSSGIHNLPKVMRHDEFTLNDNIEAMAPSMRNVSSFASSFAYDCKSSISDEEDSDDEEDDWVYKDESDSDDGIEFEKDDTNESDEKSLSQKNVSLNAPASVTEMEQQIDFMYIQMEFCEKSTLRNAIDNDIYLEKERVWRLFREIVEGLAHIHQQGMIHRDLKPVNIFLDSDDHVKIGDFGLATTSIKARINEYSFLQNSIQNIKEDAMDESKTGLIGTALYVAPELAVGSKAMYNQKVDIYSLGIIFFEMCYKPLSTSMERIAILNGVRRNEICLPEDFNEKENKKETTIIKWLLDHDAAKRPTSQELLQSEYLPPPILEECELRELVRHTLSNPQLKAYKYLVASCFNQTLTRAQDITYDRDLPSSSTVKLLQLYDFVKETILKVFKQHGAQNLSTPLLMPKSAHYDGKMNVKLMTHFGGVVTLPHDLRVPFARYIVWNGIASLRRYSIERVYREKKVFGFLPRELYECAYDIVTPAPGNLIADSEILYVVYEIINELPGVKNKNFTIRLNHTSLLKAILIQSGIKEKHLEVFQTVAEFKEGKISKSELQTYLTSFGLSDSSISALTNIFSSEYDISRAANQMQTLIKKRSGEASHLAKQALQDLKSIIQNAETFGVTFDMVIAPGLIHNIEQYSGMICQFVCEGKRKHKHSNIEVIAAGGRYDSMITSFRKILENANMLSRDIKQSAVGISISLDKLVQTIQREQGIDLTRLSSYDVAVCSVGSKLLLKEKTNILRNLWAAGIRSSLIDGTTMEDIQEQCHELKVPHAIILKDSEQGNVRVRSFEKDRFQEKTFKINEVVENMHRIIRNWREGSQETIAVTNPSKSDSKTTCGEPHDANVSIMFVTVEKLSSNARKRSEVQIRSHLDNLFNRLTGHIIVFGLSVELKVIRTLASHLEFETEQHFHKSVQLAIEKHQRHKKYLIDVCDEIYEHKLKRTKPIIVLFGLSDSSYKVLI